MIGYYSCFRKKWLFAENQSLCTRTFLPFLLAILLSSYVLPFANQAHADDIRDLDSIEALASKWEEIKKEGLSAGDVKKLTDKLKELGGKEIDGTGVKQLLDSMNANAERLANLKDAGNKLQDMIALVEKYKNLPKGDEFDGKATMEALAATLKYMSDLMGEVPPPFGTIAGPMLKAYSEAVRRGAGDIGAIQAATKAKNEAIEGKLPEGPPEDVEESFEWNVYPYRAWCPKCETDWWIAGNSAARASTLEAAYQKVKKAADALSDQAKETRDRLVREGYREKTAERMANEQEVLFEGRTRPLIDAWNALNREVQKLQEEFEKADEHAEKIRQMFIACLEKCNEEETTLSGVGQSSGIGCADGSREGFLDLHDLPGVAACGGNWGGAINGPSAAGLCATGWSVCNAILNSQHAATLKSVSMSEAVSFEGCYSYAVANDFGKTQLCTGQQHMDDMAGTGNSCKQFPSESSALANGRVDSVCCSDFSSLFPCGQDSNQPHTSGVTCCRNSPPEK